MGFLSCNLSQPCFVVLVITLGFGQWLLPGVPAPDFLYLSSWGFSDMRGREIWFHTESQGSSTVSFSHNTFRLAFLLVPNQTSSQTSFGFTAPGKAFTMLKSHTDFIVPHVPSVQKKADKCIPPCSLLMDAAEGHREAAGSPKGRQRVSPAQQHMGPRGEVTVNPIPPVFPFLLQKLLV